MKSTSSAVCVVLLLLSTSGCYWKYSNAAGDAFPGRISSQPTSRSAGLLLDGASTAPAAASIPVSSVLEMLASRLSEDRVFSPLVFPLSDLSQADPDVVLSARVVVEEHKHWTANIVKAILTGASFLLLGPVLPTHLTVVVDLEVTATDSNGEQLGHYGYRSEYDYWYTTMSPRPSSIETWLEATKAHAVEEVVNQIKADPALSSGRSALLRVQGEIGPARPPNVWQIAEQSAGGAV